MDHFKNREKAAQIETYDISGKQNMIPENSNLKNGCVIIYKNDVASDPGSCTEIESLY